MAMVYYYSMFGVSLLLVIIYAWIFHKHFDANLTIMTTLVPIINLGFVLMGNATSIDAALAALRLTYLGGCFLLVAAMFLIFNICGVALPKWARTSIIVFSCAVYATTLTIGFNDIFYVGTPELAWSNGAAYITNKHYGFMHTVFYVMVGIYYAMTIGVIIYSFFRKKQVPMSILILISLSVTIAVIGFFGGRLITHEIELLPATYNLGMIIYLIVATRLRLYNVSDSVVDSLVQKGDTGFVSFDRQMRYLGSNETAKRMWPELEHLSIDRSIKRNPWANETIVPWIEAFVKDETQGTQTLELQGAVYLVRINRLNLGRLYHGYQFLITDDTANQEHIRLIHNYNAQLEEEVKEKTRHVIAMRDKLVLGMATMVEGRDNSTGGHIKRTSDAIAILIDELKKQNYPGLDEKFCDLLIRAAPMHDIGKITVDDAILRKPGRFTTEEYEVMKTHSAEGARILTQILDGTDEPDFQRIAINVAHYHHEKWDGTGYPVGLKGEDIPLESRIMAVVDVYDALVSKRAYKQSMSYEKAHEIIVEGMGHHFDPSLKEAFLSAEPRLQAYYDSVDH
ncbi:MAG: HD domain-containing protein [Bacilli bacterium]|nr:HD domain-containing protein [Bacilli bacterium]